MTVLKRVQSSIRDPSMIGVGAHSSFPHALTQYIDRDGEEVFLFEKKHHSKSDDCYKSFNMFNPYWLVNSSYVTGKVSYWCEK